MDRSLKKIFVTGTGTGIGKTVVSAIITEALQAEYWKPIQAGLAETTDSEWIQTVISPPSSRVHPELYRLEMPASPHIAAAHQDVHISINEIIAHIPATNNRLVIEGAGGLMVPLNEHEFVADLISRMNVPVILVSRNLLGSINHSLLTAMACKSRNIEVLGWVFNDNYLNYEHDIVRWTGIPAIASIPFHAHPDTEFVSSQAAIMAEKMKELK